MRPVLPRDEARELALATKGIKTLFRRPLTGVWNTPYEEDDPDGQFLITNWPANSPIDPPPTLLNGWEQPGGTLEPFSYRWHTDGSLETKGHLSAVGAVSGSIVMIYPPSYRLLKDQYWDTVITDDDGTSFQLALAFLSADTGELTLTWPMS